MAAPAAEPDEEGPAFSRTCHVCGNVVESDVWYARTEADEDTPRRVYACPNCYFDLGEGQRATYYRERV